jgi:hypothetical protein
VCRVRACPTSLAQVRIALTAGCETGARLLSAVCRTVAATKEVRTVFYLPARLCTEQSRLHTLARILRTRSVVGARRTPWVVLCLAYVLKPGGFVVFHRVVFRRRFLHIFLLLEQSPSMFWQPQLFRGNECFDYVGRKVHRLGDS